MASSVARMSRDEHRKNKEIEEMRKAGTLAPEVDEDGNMINPHIPQYMSQAPWYLNATEGSGLKHQKSNKVSNWLTGSESRAVKSVGTKREKQAVSRTRDEFGEKIKKTKPGRRGKNKEEDADLPKDNGYDETFDGKHDRWNGYDPSQYKEVIDLYDKIEGERRKKKAAEIDERFKEKAKRKEEKKRIKEAKRKLKERKLKAKLAASETDGTDSDSDSDSDSDDSDSDDDDLRMVEDATLGAGFDNHEGGSKGIRTTVRNLRIREDTAKYLYNLDPSSAYYDPKTRSMRADPRPHIDAKDKLYAGDNMVKASGEVGEFTDTQLYAWNASQRGHNLTLEAAPSAAHFMHNNFNENKETLAEKQQRLLREKYGDAAGEAPDKSLLLGQSENYVEYDRTGRITKGADKVVPKTKYAEDTLLGNHTTVWGSYYDPVTRMWGFACCKQTQRAAYCIQIDSSAAEAIGDEAAMPPPAAPVPGMEDPEIRKMLEAPELSKKELKAKKKKEEEEKAERLKAALEKEEKVWKKSAKEVAAEEDDRKRKYNSMESTDVNDEEMEAYKMKRTRADDPMAQFM